ATLANSLCLCRRCNHIQYKESWATYQKFCKRMRLANPTVKPTEEEPKIDDINRHPERLGPDQPLKLFPNFHNYGADARSIKMYYKVMDRFVELPEIARSENEIKKLVINLPGTIARGGSAYLTSHEEGAGILFPTSPGLRSVVLWLTYKYGANGKGMVIFDLRYDGQKPLSKHPLRL